MGGELVDTDSPPQTLSESFEQACAVYMSMGVTYNQFWYGDSRITKLALEAHDHKQRRNNEQAWLQGLYVYNAIANLSPILHAFAKSGTKPVPYPERPYPISESEMQEERIRKEKLREEKLRQKFEAWATMFNINWEKKNAKSNDR